MTYGDPWLAVALGAVLLGAVLALLVRRARRSAAARKAWILVDGSNVMHWQDNTPRLAPLRGVVAHLQQHGFTPGVVFDANAGWKLAGRYLGDADLARLLGLPVAQVLVVPKGTQADPFLLETARDHGAVIVTNDRYRDRVGQYPEVTRPGFLVRGGWRDGKVWIAALPEAGRAAA